MKIYSKFKDYYDVGLQYGVDTTILFKRETIEHRVNQKFLIENLGCEVERKWWAKVDSLKHSLCNLRVLNHHSKFNSIVRLRVGFCGKWYSFYKIDIGGRSHQNIPSEVNYHYSPHDDICEVLSNNRGRIMFDDDDDIDFSIQEDDSLFIKYQSPILLLQYDNRKEGYYFISNPCLKDIQFYKLYDSVTAFQTISSYLSDVLIEKKELIQLTNDDRIVKAGFNNQNFRHRK